MKFRLNDGTQVPPLLKKLFASAQRRWWRGALAWKRHCAYAPPERLDGPAVRDDAWFRVCRANRRRTRR